MIKCLYSLIEAHKFKRRLVTSLLEDTGWHVNTNGLLERGDIEIHTRHCYLITVSGAHVWLPLICRCCVKRAARTRMLKLAGAALGKKTKC